MLTPARRLLHWVIRSGELLACSGEERRPLTFHTLAAARSAALEWNTAGGHLGADWRPRPVLWDHTAAEWREVGR